MSRFLASDENARALQISGILRFGIVLFQGIILVKAGLDPYLIAVVESFYFLYNLSRYYFLSGGKYAGFSKQKERSGDFANIFWGFNLIGLLSAITCIVILITVGTDFSSLLELDYVQFVLPLLLFFSLPIDTYELFYIIRKKTVHVVAYTAIVQLIQLIGLVALLLTGYHMGHVLLFITCLFAIRYVHILLISDVLVKIPRLGAVKFVVFAMPLILHSLLAGLTDYVDGWLIKAHFDDAAFAIYRYGARELPLNAILISAVISGLIMQKNDEKQAIKQEIKRVLKTLTPILSLLILISPLLFQLVYSSDYLISALYFNLYALLILSRAVFVQVYFYRADDRWLLTWISLAEVACNIGLSLVLLQYFGIMGVPIATLVVDVVFRIFMIVLVRQKYNKRLIEYYPVRVHMISVLALCTCFYISYSIFF